MRRIQHIAHRLILVAIILLSGFVVSYGQENTATSPYLDSEHAYRVSIGLVANTQQWIVTDKGANTFDLLSSPQPWATIGSATSDGGYDTIRIYFDRDVFSAGTWYLQFNELQDMGGLDICVASREIVLTLVENTFHLTLADNVATQCNSQSGESHTLAEVQDGDDLFDTDVTYTLTMSKSDDFDPTYWEFDVNFSQSMSNLSVVSSDGTITTNTITAGSDYNIEITPSVANPSSVTVQITVTYSNTVLADVTNNMTVSNGQAVVEAPPAPDAITDDNEAIYPLAPAFPGDRVQSITILKLPATQDIGPGAGETAATAQNPMLLSTHKYVVTMESVANTASWHIENQAGDVTLVKDTDYTLTQNQSATADTATIRFINASMDRGNYVIYFTEEYANGCSSVRPYPITVGDPFDVDIAAASDLCPAKSGVEYNDYATTAYNTDVTYTVSVQNAGYSNNWSFDVAVTTDGTFDAADVDVNAINVSAGASYTSTDSYSGSVAVVPGTTSVTITVTYRGYHINDHNITIAITGITGGFAEADADPPNETTHALNRLPQTGTLAGIE